MCLLGADGTVDPELLGGSKQYVKGELDVSGGPKVVPGLGIHCTEVPMSFSGDTLGALMAEFRVDTLNKLRSVGKAEFLAFHQGQALEEEVKAFAKALWICLRPLKDDIMGELMPASRVAGKGSAYEMVLRRRINNTLSAFVRE